MIVAARRLSVETTVLLSLGDVICCAVPWCVQVWELLLWLKARTTPQQFSRLITLTILSAVGSVVGAVVLLTLTGGTGGRGAEAVALLCIVLLARMGMAAGLRAARCVTGCSAVLNGFHG
jgi:hypothetical protein